MNTWKQLAQHYAYYLNKDNIINLYNMKIFKDCGVMHNLHMQIKFGFSILDKPGNNANSNASGMHSEDEDDFEINTPLPNAHAQNSLKLLPRHVKLLRNLDSKNEDNLRDFLKAER